MGAETIVNTSKIKNLIARSLQIQTYIPGKAKIHTKNTYLHKGWILKVFLLNFMGNEF